MTQDRIPRGIPSAGQWAKSTHDEAALPLPSADFAALSAEMNASGNARKASEYALADAVAKCRDAHPDVARIVMVGRHPSLHAMGAYDSVGERITLTDSERGDIQRSLDLVSPSVAIREKLISPSEMIPGGGDHTYELVCNDSLAAVSG